MDVVEVLHPARHIIPLGAIGDSSGKVISRAQVASFHCAMVVRIEVGKVPENLIVRSSTDESTLYVLLGIVERVTRHHRASVQVSREDKGIGDDPSHRCQSLRLPSLDQRLMAFAIYELIWEVPIQILSIRIFSTRAPSRHGTTVAFPTSCKSIWIEGGHQPEISSVHQLGHPLILPIVDEQVLREKHHHLAPNSFIAVHVGHPLEHWPPQFSLLSSAIGDPQNQELPPLHRLPDRVLGGQVRELLSPLAEHSVCLLVGVISADLIQTAKGTFRFLHS